MTFKDENKELGKLVNINQDACEFYDNAATKVESPEIKQTFQKLKALHAEIVGNLQGYIRQNGGQAEAHETVVGKSAQFFAELMTKISNDVDETLVSHLEEAEDRCLHSIQDAMKDNDLSPETKNALQNEMTTLHRTHDYMKALKDALKAA